MKHPFCFLSEHGIVPVTSDCQHLFPVKVVSRLVKWVTLAYEDYLVGGDLTGPSSPADYRPCHFSAPGPSPTRQGTWPEDPARPLLVIGDF